MAATPLFALAILSFSWPVLAGDAVPHVVAVATARATIVSGVRVSSDRPLVEAQIRLRPEQKPREIPCPERNSTPCRLIVVDMP